MPTLDVNGIHFYYESHGKGEPLILISPFASNTRIFERYIPLLANHFQVIVFDPRGSGRTTASPPPYSVEMLSDDLASLMNGLKIPQAYMAGFSMGSLVIQDFALRYKEKIKKGVLIATFSRLPHTAAMQARTMGKLFEAGVNPSLVFETLLPWIYSNHFLSNSKNAELTIHEMLNDPFPQSPEGFAGQLAALESFDLRGKLKQIETNMLIIAGKEDLYTPAFLAQEVKDHLQAATIEILPEVGHMLYIEKLEETVNLIKNFLRA